ncbi:TPA: FkbM family methyltransferase, partial [Candidatus Poribacteria bacterium]|nr:FkbM family methyltransferase [Candidatus Poribacteria bacterium]
MSLVSRAWKIYREEGFSELNKNFSKYVQWKIVPKYYSLKAKYYQLKGIHTFSVRNIKTKMYTREYWEALGLTYAYAIERAVIKDLLNNIRSGDTFYDIGAGLGAYSCLVANLVSKVVAFEPNPIVVERLKENVKLNCKPNVEVFNVAVSNSKGKTKFVLSRFYQSSHLLRANVMRKDKCLGRSSHLMSAYIGLDVHKDWTFATVLDQTGRVVVRRKLENE